MSKLKKVLAVFAVFLVSAGAVVAVQSPASANPACPSGYYCVYENIGYSGSEIDYVSGFYGQCVNLVGWHDRVSSMKNNIGFSVTIYANSNCDAGGSNIWMYNGLGIGDARAWGFNDQADSIRFGT